MSGCQLHLVLDTNVWLDKYIPSRPGNRHVADLFAKALDIEAQFMYPVRILGDVFYQVEQNAKHYLREMYGTLSEKGAHVARYIAWDCVDNMRELGAAIGADDTDVWRACKLHGLHDDLEDNLVLAAAERAKADYLVTGDRALIQRATVAALTPEDMLRVLEVRYG